MGEGLTRAGVGGFDGLSVRQVDQSTRIEQRLQSNGMTEH